MKSKRQLFIEEYLTCFNAAEAARRAGYSSRGHCSWTTGARLMQVPEIRAAIDARIREKTMTADEVLTRLTEQARGDVGEFVTLDKNGQIVVTLPPGKTHLIKSITSTPSGLKIELYDAQNALQLIGKAHGIFREVTEQGGEVVIRVLHDDD